MTAASNKQLVQQAYQNFRSGEVQSLLNVLAEDVLWEMPEMPNMPFASARKGRAQVAQFFRKMAEVQDVLEFEPHDFIAEADKVIVLGEFKMRVKATGRIAASAWAHVWQVENGNVSLVREYVDSLAVNSAHARD